MAPNVGLEPTTLRLRLYVNFNEGKEVERKKGLGGGLPLNILFGVGEFFRVGLRYFRGWGGGGGGVRNFRGGVGAEKFSGVGGGELRIFGRG